MLMPQAERLHVQNTCPLQGVMCSLALLQEGQGLQRPEVGAAEVRWPFARGVCMCVCV